MDEILQKFLDKAPVAVMARATLVRTMADTTLDDLFKHHAEFQYTRELNFSTVSRLMTQVVFRTYPSVNAAYRQDGKIPVSITSVYNKLNGLEPGASQALVAETACAMEAIVTALPTPPDEPVPGLRLRTLDGNLLAGTDHRLGCLRGSAAAALPGMSLVVRDGRTGLLTQLVPCEDAYTNERVLHTAILPLVAADDLWLADRNFCTDDYLGGIAERDAFFLVRRHAGTKLHPLGPETGRRRHQAGTVSEHQVRIGCLRCRCVIIRLDKPLRDGTTEIRLLTNVPPEALSARRSCTAPVGRSRSAKQTASQDTACADSGGRPIVGVTALLELARWNRRRRQTQHGGPPCDATSSDPVPPRPGRSGSPCPPDRSLAEAAGAESARRTHHPHAAGGPATASASGGAGGDS